MSVGSPALPRLALTALLLTGIACASNTPQRRSWSPGMSRDLLTHFRIDESSDGMASPDTGAGNGILDALRQQSGEPSGPQVPTSQ